MTVSLALQLTAAVTTLASIWLIGDGRIGAGSKWALVSDAAWVTMEIQGALWGLIPLSIAITGLHLRAYLRWRRA